MTPAWMWRAEGRRRAWVVLVLHGENYSSETPANRIGMFLGVHESHLLDEDLGQVYHPLIHLIVHIFIPWNIDMKVATQYSHSSIGFMLLTVSRTAAIRFSSSPWHLCIRMLVLTYCEYFSFVAWIFAKLAKACLPVLGNLHAYLPDHVRGTAS